MDERLVGQTGFFDQTAKQCGEDHNINVYSSKEPSEAIPCCLMMCTWSQVSFDIADLIKGEGSLDVPSLNRARSSIA